jgi:hypothetical protein
MSTSAKTILGKIQALPVTDQLELWRQLGRLIGQASPGGPAELYGEPLTDDDIAESARVTFQVLDEEERHAGPR